MVDDTTYKIAISGFLHDIGKFAERAGFNASPDFLNNNAGLYQPYNKQQNRHTHLHAVYTAAFIDHIEKLLPEEFNKGGWGLGDSFTNLAAGHHRPETPLQWVIAMADRVGSGFDRAQFSVYNEGIGVKDYKKTRLLPLLEGISLDDDWKEDSLGSYHYRYPLRELSPEAIFPIDDEVSRLIDGEQATLEYKELFFGFVDRLERLLHRDNVPLWFEHFDSLFMIYASHIPAATVGRTVPDVSLYDHSRITAAIATAIYRYHADEGTLLIDSIRDYEPRKFLMISGNFYGIQDFIFAQGGSTGKASAKLLRGRSFYVSLISELAADMLCRELGLTPSSVVLNAAGKFTVLAPNTESAKSEVKKVEQAVNEWLIQNFYGEVTVGLASIEASPQDFVAGNFPAKWRALQAEADRKKYAKIDLEQYGGPISTYLDSFDNTLEKPLCPFCGKRPSHRDARLETATGEGECACKPCRDHIYIGEHLVKETRVAITDPEADLRGNKLLEPIFSRYQLSFDVSGRLTSLSKSDELLKYWDIGLHRDGVVAKDITAKFINGYVPKYTEDDNHDDRLLYGKKQEKTRLELLEALAPGRETPKTFLHIAKKALNPAQKKGEYTGIEALGALKADVDNLGLIFASGMREERQTLSRLATLSRQMNNYFTLYLPFVLATDKRFTDTYTVFAGGDDLFLIGPWNRVIDFAHYLSASFGEYVCRHPSISLSAGICVSKPGEPIRSISAMAEEALKESKRNEDTKDSVTLFNETVRWDAFARLQEIAERLMAWLADGAINNVMLFRLNELVEMARQERELLSSKTAVRIEDMECFKWRSRLKYSVARNVGKRLKSDERKALIDEVMEVAAWLEDYGSAFKIPLWQVIYNRR